MNFLLLFNFSKGFDTLSLHKLIRKLRDMGFSRTTLMWIKIYMIGRSQRVVSRSGETEYLETILGVPQVSVLGPLLFSIWTICKIIGKFQVCFGHNTEIEFFNF